jgi:hypothetical protein
MGDNQDDTKWTATVGAVVSDHQKHANWITIIGAVLAVVGAIISVGYGYGKFEAQYGGLPTQIEQMKDRVAKLEDRLKSSAPPSDTIRSWEGMWSGKWDNRWIVSFSIFYTNGKRFIVVYNHEENDPKKLLESIHTGILDGDIMTIDDFIIITRVSNEAARAKGLFSKGLWREADLKRDKR